MPDLRAMELVNKTDTASKVYRDIFANQGCLVVRGLLDVERDIEPFKEGYIKYLDRPADILMGDTKPDLAGEFSTLPFAKRLALLISVGGTNVLSHLDPKHSITLEGTRWCPELPIAQIPELFWLMRNETLLDALECLIGPEIGASASYDVNMMLGSEGLDLAISTARASCQPPDHRMLWSFWVRAAEWRADARHMMAVSRENKRLTAWTPITEATLETGCLEVIPGSHGTDMPVASNGRD